MTTVPAWVEVTVSGTFLDKRGKWQLLCSPGVSGSNVPAPAQQVPVGFCRALQKPAAAQTYMWYLNMVASMTVMVLVPATLEPSLCWDATIVSIAAAGWHGTESHVRQ